MSTAELLKYAAILAGYLLAFARLNDKARLFWQFLPTWAQPAMPALVVILPDLANALQKGVTIEDILTALITAGGTLMIALRGAVPAKHYEQLSPEAKGEIAAVRGTAPKDDGPPTPRTGSGAPPMVGLLLAFAIVAPGALAACSSASTPEAKGAQAANYARLGYSAAVVTVKELGDLHYQLQRTVVTEEQAKVAAVPLRKMLDALDAAKVALEKAKPYVEQSDEVEAIRYVREAVGYVDLALPMLTVLGTAPPKEVTEALGYLRGFLGGAK